jgi:hypothetical protein
VTGFVQALVLDAAMTAAESLERLGLYGADERVVIRRVYNRRLFFYLFTVSDLRGKLGRADPPANLEMALGLGTKRQPAKTLRPDQPVGRLDAVLLDVDEMVLGVWLAPPPGMRSGVPPVGTRPRHGNLRGVHDRGATRQVGAFPVLDAPDVVAPHERFDLVIGLSKLHHAGVDGDVVLEVPAEENAADLVVQVIADGFEAPEGFQRILHVVYDDLDRTHVAVPLVAREVDRPRTSLLIVHFSRDGAVCGTASRRIVVEQRPPRPTAAPGRGAAPPVRRSLTLPPRRPRAAMALRPPDDADLTLIIDKPDGNQATGRYVWTYNSPHIAQSKSAFPMDLGIDPRSFVKLMLREAPGQLGKPLQDGWIRTQAMKIGGKVPGEIWNAVRRVAAHPAVKGRPPRVLLLTSEPHIPWELAQFDPPLDESQPRFLGAQVAIARWLAAEVSPPPSSLTVERMAVIAAEYPEQRNGSAKKDDGAPHLKPLASARPEADELVRAHGATPVLAIGQEMRRLLEGEFPPGGAQAIHFIGHGMVDEEFSANGNAYLEDGTVFVPGHLFSAPVVRRERAFLFLNACEVGNGGELLGVETGFGNDAVLGGCSGFVAPVWPVFEDQAKEFAESFYRKVFKERRRVGEVMRELRAGYRTNGNGTTPAGCLCYVFYGSPALVMTRSAEAAPGDAEA